MICSDITLTSMYSPPSALDVMAQKVLDHGYGLGEQTLLSFGQRSILLSISEVSDEDMLLLNQRFRGKATSTNVLSFPVAPSIFSLPDMPIVLGDVVIARAVAMLEAQMENISLQTHLYRLLTHGILHLLGYTHNGLEDSALMALWEDRILGRLAPDAVSMVGMAQ